MSHQPPPSYSMDPLESRLLLSGRVVGYFPEYRWSTFPGIDLNNLTHVNYFSVTADSRGRLVTGNINLSHMATLVSAAHGQGVEVSVTVGPQSFGTIARKTSSINTFVNNIVNFATTHGLDGIDLDWEPTPTGADKTRYATLINALHTQTSTRGLTLTAAVNPWNFEVSATTAAKLDWLNVMCYDFAPDNHSPYAVSTAAMLDWADTGVPRDKLVMGVPFYGRAGSSWSTTTARTYGALVNDYLAANGTYPSDGLDLINGYHFNGKTTIGNKAQFVVNEGFGGVMIWELGQDHFVNGQPTSMSLLPVIADVVLTAARAAPLAGQMTSLFSTSMISVADVMEGVDEELLPV